MKLTPFGVLVRQLRIAGEIKTKEMSEALDVSPAYLSALETGKKNLPDKFVEKIVEFFYKRGIDASALPAAAVDSRTIFKMEPNDKDRELVAAFARKFPNMPEDKKMELLMFLNKT